MDATASESEVENFAEIPSELQDIYNQQLVDTIDGTIPRNQLTVRDIIFEEPNSRAIATEYYYEGKLVKRDVAVSILHSIVVGTVEQGATGG